MPYTLELPSISVVIATYNRPQSLARVVRQLSEQLFFRFEHLDCCVVDDGSQPQVGFSIDWGSLPFKAEYIYRERHPDDLPRVYSSRNIAIRHTHNDVILFLDDDLIFHPHALFLIQLYHAFIPNCVLVPHLANRVAKHYYLIPFEIRREGPASWVTSAGMSCPRSLVEKVGGFDEEFDLSMGFADRDFGIRLVEAGGEVVLANGIPMMVDDSESQGSWRDRVLRRFDREHPGQTHPNWLKLIKKYPELAK